MVLLLEEILHSCGRTLPAWDRQLRAVWRASLARALPSATSPTPAPITFKDLAMHLAALQSYLTQLPHRLTRLAFTRISQHYRCPLYFPVIGETVTLLRSGVMVRTGAGFFEGRRCPQWFGSTKLHMLLAKVMEAMQAGVPDQHTERMNLLGWACMNSIHPLPPPHLRRCT